ncbi:hypothetical protein VSX64_23305 [Aurantimonas sp. C2-6-R+9]|nr:MULTISPECIES: hypothetical protein [unclassified Aurantimonas]MEC5293507.1 hypothetical protein [Aurantimonas sp. C2-3-R2]MEC5383683.1 hypothetical protein [Aurantimonas sp. C2-6-R+9]MEC5414584.1 hypothetical protein [Aurantimonas sp. C2-4-R8]
MTQSTEGRLYMSANGVRRPIGPDDAHMRVYHESIIRADYDRSHPDDSFEDLKHRARFSKEDQGLLRDWMAIAAERALQQRKDSAPEINQLSIAALGGRYAAAQIRKPQRTGCRVMTTIGASGSVGSRRRSEIDRGLGSASPATTK